MTEGICLSAERIADVVEGTASVADIDHAANCARCNIRVSLVRRAANAGIIDVCRAVDEIEALLATLHKWKRTHWESVAAEAEFQQPDLVRRLLSLATALRFEDRNLSIDYARVATAVTDRVNPPDWDLSFEAWKLRYALQREAGRFSDAEGALQRAESMASLTSNPHIATASTWLSRALLFAEPDIWRRDEALELLDRADAVFALHDATKLRLTEAVRGFVFYRSAELSSALLCFEHVLANTPASDGMAVLDASANIAWVRVALRITDAALKGTLLSLIASFDTMKSTERAARLRWALARLEQHAGNFAEALALLVAARNAIGSPDASLRVGLDVVENYLLQGDAKTALAVAQNLATESIARERSEPTRRRTLTAEAFSYVRQAAQLEMLTPDLVAEVATFVDRITWQRPVGFKPPMPLAAM